MTFTLAPEGYSDAELLHRIAVGDPGSAARLWTRHWPAALEAARTLVDPVEVPGLAAEALIGTLAAVALGSGPTEDAGAFVVAAVHELGDDEVGAPSGTTPYPDVFTSPTLVQAFGALTPEDQEELGTAEHASALGRLQDGYLRLHARAAASPDCVDVHSFLGAAVEDGDPVPAIPERSWVHLSECAVCTEAFHELAHTGVALGALLGLRLDTPAPAVAEEVEPDPAAVAAAAVLTALAADEEISTTLAAAPPVPEVSEYAPEPVHAVAEPSPVPAAEPAAGRRRRRPLVVLAAGAALASVIGVSVAAARDGEPAKEPAQAAGITDSGPVLDSAPPAVTDPTVPAEGPTTDALAADADVPDTEPESATNPVTADEPTAAASKPRSSARPSSTATPRSSSPSPKPAPESPSGSATPSSSPSPTKPPTPSPTPKKTCSPLEVLLGCRPG